jgi:DNA-binding GntR family transcriptional regulator
MSDRIRDKLMSQILTGRLPPGSRLVELDLAKQFDTSQTPVREALRELETMRLVESVPYRGTRVREISDQEMSEAYALRGVLEQFAGELSATHFKGNTEDLTASVAALHAAAQACDMEAYCRHNLAFHRCIVEHSGNRLLIQAWHALAFEARVRIHLSRVNTPDLAARAAEHDPIVAALRAGKGQLAGRLLREHAESCHQRWNENRKRESALTDAGHGQEGTYVQAGVLS